MRSSVRSRPKVAQRRRASDTEPTPRRGAVAELLARAERLKHREVDLRPSSREGRSWTASRSVSSPEDMANSAARNRREGGKTFPAKSARPLRPPPLEQLPVLRAFESQRSPQLKAAIREGAAAASPVVKDALAWLREALRPQPVLAPRANAEAETFSHQFEHALSCELRRGGRVLAIAGVIAVGWAGLIPLSGAVIVAGQLVLHSNVKKVQHPTGGVVAEIFVRNGSKVNAGDQLARLDETAARTNLQVVARQLDEVRLRIARLNAERDGAAEPRWPTASAAEIAPFERDRLLNSERDFFAVRAIARRGEQNLAQSRIDQLEKQIAGLQAQQEFEQAADGHHCRRAEKRRGLACRRSLSRCSARLRLQRDAARMEGLDGQLASQIAETSNKVHEARLQALQTEQSFRSEIMRELSEAEAKEGELIERRLAAEDQLKRTVIRAPTPGTIHELAVHTAGGVVSPAEVLMLVVPDGDALEIDARLTPDKIDQVRTGQSARIRLSAFNAGTTPELDGAVDAVSPDLVRDPNQAHITM